MKRLFNGVTLNTKTSTVLARLERGDDTESFVGVLYQTRGGAFFVNEVETKQIWSPRHEAHLEHESGTNYPVSPDEALKWIMQGGVEVFHNPFDDPPKATAKSEPGATIYVRVPASLKKRVDNAAREAKLSSNVWVMQCIEQRLDKGVRGIHSPA